MVSAHGEKHRDEEVVMDHNEWRQADHLEQQPQEGWSVDDEREAERIDAEPQPDDEELEEEVIDAMTAREIAEAEAGAYREDGA